MRPLLLGALVVSLTAGTADARRHARYYSSGFPFHFLDRIFRTPRSYHSHGDHRSRHDSGAEKGSLSGQVPADWHLQPSQPDYHGQRYLSPGGDARLEFYDSPADADSQEQHGRDTAFHAGEEVAYLKREPARIAVYGFTDGTRQRIFYRKAVLACGGQQWRHIVAEYPLERKQDLDRLTAKLALTLERATNKSCANISAGAR